MQDRGRKTKEALLTLEKKILKYYFYYVLHFTYISLFNSAN